MVVLTSYREGAMWRPRRLTTGQGILALLANTVNVRRQPQRTFVTLQRAASGVTFWKGPRGEAEDIVATVLSKAAAERA
jgi:hypothetical protein